MDKIEIGEYIRNANGEIHKVTKVEKLGEHMMNYYCFEKNFGNFEVHIKKHRKNIKDLIEEGDYVNGRLVTKAKVANGDEKLLFEEIIDLELINIKTILTHEQYEQNCYRLEK